MRERWEAPASSAGDGGDSESDSHGSSVWRQSNPDRGPLFDCTGGREFTGGPDDGGIEGGRRWRGWWVDDGGTVVPVAWPTTIAATMKQQQQPGANLAQTRNPSRIQTRPVSPISPNYGSFSLDGDGWSLTLNYY